MSILKADSPNRFSFFAFLFISITFVGLKMQQVSSVEPFIRDSYALSWDNYGYYLHLPAFVIHHDIGIEDRSWLDTLNNKYQKDRPFYQASQGQKNRLVNVYPIGSAIFNLPFFIAGHLSAKIFGYAADGLSPPYQWAMIFSALFYGIIGMWFLRKLLIRYFNDRLTAILLLLIGLGTNLFYYAIYDCNLPHITLFAADTLILILTVKWHEQQKWKYAFAIGILIGLVTVTRPSEIVWILIPLFWNVSGWKSLKEKFQLLRQNIFHVLLLIFGMLAVGSLQLFYWKYTSGNWFSFNHTEGFDFFRPFTLKVLFSYKKGWLLYTPMMMLSIFGFAVLFKKDRKLFLPLLIFFFANLWFISSWECWWYAGSFGQRPFVQSYGLMAIPLGFAVSGATSAAVSGLPTRHRVLRIAIFCLAGFFLLLNQFQTWQMNHDILSRELMTKEYYWKTFGATSVQPEWNSLLEIDRGNLPPLDSVLKNYKIMEIEIPIIPDKNFKDRSGIEGPEEKLSIHLDSINQFGATFKKPFCELTQKDHLRLRLTVYLSATEKLAGHPFNLVFSMTGSRGQSYGYSSVQFDTTEVKPNQFTAASADFVTPEILHADDVISVNVWDNGGSPLLIERATLAVYEPK